MGELQVNQMNYGKCNILSENLSVGQVIHMYQNWRITYRKKVNVSSIQTTLVGGDPGILFRATATSRVRLVQVVVRNPNNNSISYSPQGLIVQANEAFDLQEAGTAFYRWSGNWQFTFVGNHEPGGQSFEVVQTLSVSAKERP